MWQCCNSESGDRRQPREGLGGEGSGGQIEQLVDELILFANIFSSAPQEYSNLLLQAIFVVQTTENGYRFDPEIGGKLAPLDACRIDLWVVKTSIRSETTLL
jgi:hypothetical protein